MKEGKEDGRKRKWRRRRSEGIGHGGRHSKSTSGYGSLEESLRKGEYPEGAEAFLGCNVFVVGSPYLNVQGEKLMDISNFLNTTGL